MEKKDEGKLLMLLTFQAIHRKAILELNPKMGLTIGDQT
jgi:hypothetical protein